jgi:hypothetical protein
MTLTKLRAIITTVVTILSAILAILPTDAKAVQATLVSCNGATSVTGHYIYVGTYRYGSQVFQMTFTQWCPYSVEVQ